MDNTHFFFQDPTMFYTVLKFAKKPKFTIKSQSFIIKMYKQNDWAVMFTLIWSLFNSYCMSTVVSFVSVWAILQNWCKLLSHNEKIHLKIIYEIQILDVS